jgi:DNA-binding transcriptional LysR family regulator
MRVNLTLAQLQAFLQVASTSSFRAAAQALHVSQPALSRTIRIAEESIGARLFDRDTRHVALTATGRELLPIARRILEDFNGAFSELAQFLEGRSGLVTIAALPSIGIALLPQAISAFRREHPQVEFAFIEGPSGTLTAAVDAGQADFAVGVRPAPDLRLKYRHLIEDPFVLLCRKDDPLATRASVPWTVLAGRPFLASTPPSSIRPITDAVFVQKGLQVRPAFECPSVAACGAMVAAGLGLTVLPHLALYLVNRESLATVPLQRPQIARHVGILTRAGRSLSPASRAFMATLERCVADQR